MTFVEMFASDFLVRVIIRALVVGVLVSLCSAVLGVSLVLKRYSMIGDGLSHVGFFAVALSACAGAWAVYSMEISVVIVVIAAVLILRLSKSNGKMSGDAACAVVSTGAVAAGTLIYNFTGGRAGDICNSLFGSASVVSISDKDMIISIALSAVVMLYFLVFSKIIFAVTFDETFSRAAGVRTDSFGVTLAVLTGITIVVGMKMMGSIMISALIIFPPLTAMRITKSFKLTVVLSAVISIVCFIVGFFAACLWSLQTGAAVVGAELICFVLVCAVTGAVSKAKIRHRARAVEQ